MLAIIAWILDLGILSGNPRAWAHEKYIEITKWLEADVHQTILTFSCPQWQLFQPDSVMTTVRDSWHSWRGYLPHHLEKW